MFAVVHIPDFSLQACLAGDSLLDEEPAVLIAAANAVSDDRRKARILALNDAARAASIHVGMTPAQAQARCGGVLILDRSLEAERRMQEALLGIANGVTSDFEDTAPGVCTLDLMGLPCEHGWNLGWRIVEELSEHSQARAQVGIAATPDLASLVARVADPVRSIVGEEMENGFLWNLPITELDPPADVAMVLTLWGIESIGDFLALPEHEVADRLGLDALDLWERAAGGKSRLLRLVRPPKDFAQSLDFDYEVCGVEPLLFALRRVLETLCARLQSAWLVAGEIDLRLRFENGSGYIRRFRIPDPTIEIELLFRILHAHLEDFETKAPVVGLRVEMVPAQAIRQQLHLFESGMRDPNRFAETLARLEALLGSENVGVPESLDTHRPDSFQLVPYREDAASAKKESSHRSAVAIGLPLRRFRPSIYADVCVCPQTQRPLEVRSPMAKGRVCDSRGPWVISGDWWCGKDGADGTQSSWSRVEWDVEILQGSGAGGGGGLYRLARESSGEWKLEGVYG